MVAVTRGLWLERTVVEREGSHAWIEVPLSDGPYAPATVLARVQAISRLAGEELLRWLRLPDAHTLAVSGVFVYAPMRPGTSVFEMLEAGGGQERAIPFPAIGRRLAALHGTRLDDAASLSLSRGRPPLDILGLFWSDAPADGELALLRRCLAACEPFRRLVMSTSEADGSPGVLLHGRWSTGALICPAGEPDGVIACGGIDAWIGPPEFDVGYLFGDLVELAAASWLAGASARVADALAAMLAVTIEYRRYRCLDAGRIAGFTARRILSHLVANARWRRQEGHSSLSAREIMGLFSAAEGILPELERCLR